MLDRATSGITILRTQTSGLSFTVQSHSSLHGSDDCNEGGSISRAIPSLIFEDPSLLRGTPAVRVLNRFARVLSSKPCTAKYYELSRVVDEIDIFISHNWSTPHVLKYITALYYFNRLPAIVGAVLASSCAFVLTVLGKWPAFMESSSYDLHLYSTNAGCLTCGMATFFIVFFSGHRLRQLVGIKGSTVFLDKTCVSQTDDALKRRGIAKLAAFLFHSRGMLVLYSDMYLQKLWTVYEIATYLLLAETGNLVVIPVFLPPLAIVFLVVCVVGRIVCTWLRKLLVHNVDINTQSVEQLVAYQVVMLAPFVTLMTGVLRKWCRERLQLRQSLRQFSVRHATCLSEEDRLLVEENIATFTRQSGLADSKSTKFEALHAFDAFVHDEVPKVLKLAFGRWGVRYEDAAMICGPYFFMWLDKIGSMVNSGEWTPLELVLFVFWSLSGAAVIAPLYCVGLPTIMSNWSLHFRGVWGVFIVVVIALVNTGTMITVIVWALTLVGEAASSKVVFAKCMALWFVHAVLCYIVYRPLPALTRRRSNLSNGRSRIVMSSGMTEFDDSERGHSDMFDELSSTSTESETDDDSPEGNCTVNYTRSQGTE